MKKIRKAIIPAAGLGTRVLPASKAVPKEMLNIVDKPAIQYIVEEAFNSGIEEVLIITNRGKGAIEDHFDHAFELETKLEGINNHLRPIVATMRLFPVHSPLFVVMSINIYNDFFIGKLHQLEKSFAALEGNPINGDRAGGHIV